MQQKSVKLGKALWAREKLLKRLMVAWVLLFCCICTYAQKRYSMSFKNEIASKALTMVEKKTGVNIQYKQDDMKFKVTVQAKNRTPLEIVKMIVSLKGFAASASGNYIIVHKLKTQAASKVDFSEGVVYDENREPMIGVIIKVKGHPDAAVTDMNGKYILHSKVQDAEVIVSYTGYKQQRFPIAQFRKMKTVRMEPLNNTINDVVVTGYFDREKTTFTGSAAKYSHDQLAEFGTTNIYNILQNLDPSFKVKENTSMGSDPNSLPDFVVRGESSFQGTSLPTIIVDGYEVSMQYLYDMDVDRIESISILKDASATVYYGSRAANGVIVIETRRPEMGKLRVSYSNKTGLTLADLTSYHLMNASQKLEFEKLAGVWSNSNPETQFELDQAYEALRSNVARGINTYWMSQPLRTGLQSTHSIYVEGGDKVVTYGLTGYYGLNQGVMKGSDRSNYGLSFDLGYRIKDKIKIRNSFSYTYNSSNNSPYGSFSSYTAANPYSPIYDEDGNYVKVYEQHMVKGSGSVHYNYLYNATLPSRSKSSGMSISDQLSFDYRILPALRLRMALSYSKYQSESQSYVSPKDVSYYNVTDTSKKGKATSSHSNSQDIDFTSTLAYNLTLAKKHNIYIAAGVNLKESKSYTESFSATGFVDDRFNQIGYAAQYAEGSTPSSSSSLSRLVGFIGNVNYSYNDRYFADFATRFDGSSLYGSNAKFGTLWSLGAGWNIHREKFFHKIAPWVSEFKLRASYGVTGSANFSPEVARTTMRFSTSSLYYGVLPATFIQYGNPNLTWQQNKQLNMGVDFALAHRRLNFRYDHYRSVTNGLLLPVDVAPSLGFTSYTENFGEIENVGDELSLDAIVVRSKDLDLGFHLSVAHNRNKIRKINDALASTNSSAGGMSVKQDTRPQTYYEEGQSMNVIRAVKSLGIDPADGREMYEKLDGTVTKEWSSDDLQVLGSTDADIEGNFGFNIVWKQWTLSTSFRYSYGGQAYNSTLAERVEGLNVYENGDVRALEGRWKKPGDVTFFKDIADRTTSKTTSRFIQDNNYLQMSNLAIYYKFAHKLLRRIGIDNIKLGTNLSDVFYLSTIKRERGLDYPFARTFSFSFNLSF